MMKITWKAPAPVYLSSFLVSCGVILVAVVQLEVEAADVGVGVAGDVPHGHLVDAPVAGGVQISGQHVPEVSGRAPGRYSPLSFFRLSGVAKMWC